LILILIDYENYRGELVFRQILFLSKNRV